MWLWQAQALARLRLTDCLWVIMNIFHTQQVFWYPRRQKQQQKLHV